jgi:hypothetical protein
MIQGNFKTQTPYDWCVEYNIRPLDLNQWPQEWYGSKEKHFFEISTVPRNEFLEWIRECKVKPNSQPRKTEQYLEYRLYGLVPYNISSIQSAIQYGHAVQEYNNLMIDGSSNMQSVKFDSELINSNKIAYDKWRKKDKTFIILNGGTTNDNINDKWYGSLQKSRDILYNNGILFSEFYEPDLNNALTAIVFLVDERVWNKTLYANFEKETLPYSRKKPSQKDIEELENRNRINYGHWVTKIGGPKNAFLREFLSSFKLAN